MIANFVLKWHFHQQHFSGFHDLTVTTCRRSSMWQWRQKLEFGSSEWTFTGSPSRFTVQSLVRKTITNLDETIIVTLVFLHCVDFFTTVQFLSLWFVHLGRVCAFNKCGILRLHSRLLHVTSRELLIAASCRLGSRLVRSKPVRGCWNLHLPLAAMVQFFRLPSHTVAALNLIIWSRTSTCSEGSPFQRRGTVRRHALREWELLE